MSTVPRARLYILSRAMSAGSAHVPSQFARAVTRAVYGAGNSRALPGMLAIVLCFGARRCRESKRAAGGATTPPYSCSRAGQKADLFDVAKLFLQDLAKSTHWTALSRPVRIPHRCGAPRARAGRAWRRCVDRARKLVVRQRAWRHNLRRAVRSAAHQPACRERVRAWRAAAC